MPEQRIRGKSRKPSPRKPLRRPGRLLRRPGFTLLELMIVLAILVIVATIALPLYFDSMDESANEQAIADLREVSAEIERYISVHRRPPNTLKEAGLADLRDRWGNPYGYVRIDNLGGKPTSPSGEKVRKDHNLKPINSDYDLYSMGADGQSMAPLTAAQSRDDIIRAQDGAFFGIAEDY